MALLTNVVTTLMVLLASQQFMLVSCQVSRRATEKVKDTGDGLKSPVKGRFTAKDKSQCTWVATGIHDLTLGVTCKKSSKSYSCEYIARPATCPQYVSNAKLYWKQISRALSKQKKLCQDSSALVKAGLCRKAPEDAHFRLNNAARRRTATTTTATTTASPQQPAGLKACPDSEKLAETHCYESWSSFCVFLFSMLQNGDC